MAIIFQEGPRSDFINYLKNKAKFGISAPPINTGTGGSRRFVESDFAAIQAAKSVEPIPSPESSEGGGADISVLKVIDFTDSPYDILLSDEMIGVDATGGDVDLMLPSAADFPAGTGFIVKKLDGTGNSVNVYAYSGERIDGFLGGSPGVPLTTAVQWESFHIVNSGLVGDALIPEWEVI